MIKFITLQNFFFVPQAKTYFTRLKSHKLKAVYMGLKFSVLERIRRHIQSLLSIEFCLNLALHSILWVTVLAS